jgi:recombination protein RecT
MANEVQKYISNDSVQARINKLLDKRASQFTTSLLAAVNTNNRLANCKPETVLNAALTAASLNLPINSNLGFAALVPYGNSCQFQIMVRGFIQLAQRSGQYQTISATPVYEGQLVSEDPLKGFVWDWSVKPKPDEQPIGYAAYFELLNGFSKTLYMDMDTINVHGKRYSKTFNDGPWKSNFEAMALKTVLKLLIARFGPMSTEMETALESDQAVIGDDKEYIDNPQTAPEKPKKEVKSYVSAEEVKTAPAASKEPQEPVADEPEHDEKELEAMRESITSATELLEIEPKELQRIYLEVSSLDNLGEMNYEQLNAVYDYLSEIEHQRSEEDAAEQKGEQTTLGKVQTIFDGGEDVTPKKS